MGVEPGCLQLADTKTRQTISTPCCRSEHSLTHGNLDAGASGCQLLPGSGFSRKFQNHEAALNYFVYNFIRIHPDVARDPAMAAGVTNRLWEVSDLVALPEAAESKKAA